MFQARVTAADQAFLEAYKALCVQHGLQFDVWGHDFECEIGRYLQVTEPILFAEFSERESPGSSGVTWQTTGAQGNSHLAKQLLAVAIKESSLIDFVKQGGG